MLKIAKSLIVIAAVAALAVGATSAIFTSQASVSGNTFASGALEIKLDGQTSLPGFNFSNAAPGDNYTGTFDIQNFNAAQFGGNSTLPAKSVKISAANSGGSIYLYNKLDVMVTSTVGWNDTVVFTGKLKNLLNKEILLPGNQFPAGWTMPMTYTVTLPSGADNTYQGLSTTFDFVVTASSS